MAKRKPPVEATKTENAEGNGVLILHVHMDGYDAMWRRLSVPAHFSLYDLHEAIQAVTLFTDSHMHQFVDKQRNRYVSAPPDDFGIDPGIFGLDDEDDQLDTETSVGTVLKKKGDKLRYDYDFGDSWLFIIKVEKCLPASNETASRIVCLGGEMAGPVDDCGGVPGFEQMLQALARQNNPKKRDKELLEWLTDMVDSGYDAARFDIEDANRKLARIKGPQSTAKRKRRLPAEPDDE